MRVLVSSTKFSGHLNPLLPYATAIKRRGHDLLVAAPDAAAEPIRQRGLDHRGFPELSEEKAKAAWARLDQAKGERGSRDAGAEVFVQMSEAALPGLRTIIEEWRPDLILRESLELGALVAAEASGVPSCRVGVHCGAGEMDWYRHIVEPMGRFRTCAGLPAEAGASIRGEPVFSVFPAFMDDGVDWLGTRPPFRTKPFQARPRTSDSTGWAWTPGEGETFVYVTFGTVSGRSEKSRAAYRAVLKALSTLPVKALLTTGPIMPREELGNVPPNVMVETFVPQADILPFADAVVCHGGSGSLLGALAHGIPTVVVPLFADQPHNAATVERIGAGICVTERTTADFRASIDRVLSDGAFRRAARALADDIAGMPDVEHAVQLMEEIAPHVA
jgi:UDP:flavonoid glycosyltransferase YjiC (YdhE family)